MIGLAGTSLINDANLNAYYQLEKNALTTDYKNTYTLTNNNSVVSGNGRFAYAADFGASNTNKYLSTNGSSWGLIASSNFSVSCWIKLETEVTAGQYGIWNWQPANNVINVDLLYEYNSGTPRLNFRWSINGGSSFNTTYTVSLGTSSWHHIVCTYDGSNLRIYFDNSLVAGPTAASGSGSASSTATSSIGTSLAGGGFVQGLIDDVAIFSRALSAAEVTKIYNSPLSDLGLLMGAL